MTAQDANNGTSAVPKISAPIVTVYIGAVAALYQHTFWRPFHVDILQFVSLADMVKLALWPLIGFAISFGIGAFVGRVGRLGEPIVTPPTEVEGFRKFRAFVNGNPGLVLLWIAFLGNTVMFVIYGSPLRWFSISFLVGLVAFAFLVGTGRVPLVIAGQSLPGPAVLVLVLLPCFAWGAAKQRSEEIRNGFEYELATVTPAFRKLAAIPDTKELRYLGNTGSHTILLVESGPQVVIARNEEIGPISLRPVSRSPFSR